MSSLLLAVAPLLLAVAPLLLALSLPAASAAAPQVIIIETFPLDGNIAIEKLTVLLRVPADNELFWATVEGRIANHVPGHQAIIQIHSPVTAHFAQVDVGEDGEYEYRFRVRYMEDGSAVDIFKGDYLVSVFGVVYLPDSRSLESA